MADWKLLSQAQPPLNKCYLVIPCLNFFLNLPQNLFHTYPTSEGERSRIRMYGVGGVFSRPCCLAAILQIAPWEGGLHGRGFPAASWLHTALLCVSKQGLLRQACPVGLWLSYLLVTFSYTMSLLEYRPSHWWTGGRLHPWTWLSGLGKCGSTGLHAGAGSVRKVNGYHSSYSPLVSLSVFLCLITLTPNSLFPSPLAGYLCSFPAFISSQHHPKCKAKLYCKISCYKMW